ncbi:MAG TPA: hypothetical protein ENH06_01255 [bacterium]|nr:hypothetical protein [bacterium]
MAHFSIGDMTRRIEKEWSNPKIRKEIMEFLEKNYRGYISLEDAILRFKKRDTKNLLPTELILTLVKREISKLGKKTLFIDGFPRNLNQISYSLFFRDLIDYRKDPDIFVLIDVPEQAINERIKHRRICPICQTPRNLKLFPTQKIKYDQENKEFYLVCDNKNCNKARMVSKEGDELGIGPIKNRLKMDEKLIQEIISLHGIPKIFLRNSIPVKNAKQYINSYEVTPKYSYKWDKKTKNVQIIEDPWIIKDSQGAPSYSLLAPPVTVSLIKQMSKILNI